MLIKITDYSFQYIILNNKKIYELKSYKIKNFHSIEQKIDSLNDIVKKDNTFKKKYGKVLKYQLLIPNLT